MFLGSDSLVDNLLLARCCTPCDPACRSAGERASLSPLSSLPTAAMSTEAKVKKKKKKKTKSAKSRKRLKTMYRQTVNK